MIEKRELIQTPVRKQWESAFSKKPPFVCISNKYLVLEMKPARTISQLPPALYPCLPSPFVLSFSPLLWFSFMKLREQSKSISPLLCLSYQCFCAGFSYYYILWHLSFSKFPPFKTSSLAVTQYPQGLHFFVISSAFFPTHFGCLLLPLPCLMTWMLDPFRQALSNQTKVHLPTWW